MLDQLRRDIQTRLDELLAEANKLRHALVALASDERTTAATANGRSSRPRSRTARSAPATRAPARRPARSSTRAKSATAAATPKPEAPRATTSSVRRTATVRTSPGATKTAVLAALANGEAMTAGEVANATGLGRATVSTTLSKLAKAGQVTKAARGYQIAGQTTA